MLDELFETLVDKACERGLAFLHSPNREAIRIKATTKFGSVWHFRLYRQRASGIVGSMFSGFSNISNEDNANHFLRWFLAVPKKKKTGRPLWLMRLDAFLGRLNEKADTLRFTGFLFLLMLAVLGTLYAGGRELACCAAACAFLFLSTAMRADYQPVCGALRQRYIWQQLMRGAAFLLPLASYFLAYISHALPTNIVLQAAMLILVLSHFAVFGVMILFNQNQWPLMRALSGVVGTVPALAAAASFALLMASAAQSKLALVAGVLRAFGMLLAFFAGETEDLLNLTKFGLRFPSLLLFLLYNGGMLLMICGAWLGAGI